MTLLGEGDVLKLLKKARENGVTHYAQSKISLSKNMTKTLIYEFVFPQGFAFIMRTAFLVRKRDGTGSIGSHREQRSRRQNE